MVKIKSSHLRQGNLMSDGQRAVQVLWNWLGDEFCPYQPIELTPAFAENMGFSKKRHVWGDGSVNDAALWFGDFFIEWTSDGCFIARADCFNRPQYLASVEWVHELQNIYFYLQKKELLNI